jgi:lysophospholipase L1-like esterase
MKDIVKDDLKQYSWGATNFPRMLDGLIMTLLPFFKDWFSKARKLSLTVDGAHFNSKSAKLIAKAIEVVLLLQLQEE